MSGRKADSSGIAVAGFGKLGSGELGYGSDLDIIFIYRGSEMERKGKGIGLTEYYARLSERAIFILTSLTREGFLFRVDLGQAVFDIFPGLARQRVELQGDGAEQEQDGGDERPAEQDAGLGGVGLPVKREGPVKAVPVDDGQEHGRGHAGRGLGDQAVDARLEQTAAAIHQRKSSSQSRVRVSAVVRHTSATKT